MHDDETKMGRPRDQVGGAPARPEPSDGQVGPSPAALADAAINHADTASSTGELTPGTLLLNTYRVDALIGRGGMGDIYRATHVEMATRHAVKVIRSDLARDPRVAGLFKREAGSLRDIRHDAISLYDGLFRDDMDRLYLVMEFVEGRTLKDLLADGPLSIEEVRELRDRLASGLALAHDKGIVHRDISPDNILIPDRRMGDAKIIDFGIAKLTEGVEGTIFGDDFKGKYAYASPEQLDHREIDARSDIYSLGLVLAAAAKGESLDAGTSLYKMLEARRTVPDLSGVPEELRAELAAMLQPDPQDRPSSMRQLIGWTGPAEGHSSPRSAASAAPDVTTTVGSANPSPQRRPADVEEGTPGRRRARLLYAATAAASVVAIGTFGAWHYLSAPAPTPAGSPLGALSPASPGAGTLGILESSKTARIAEPAKEPVSTPSPTPTTGPASPTVPPPPAAERRVDTPPTVAPHGPSSEAPSPSNPVAATTPTADAPARPGPTGAPSQPPTRDVAAIPPVAIDRLEREIDAVLASFRCAGLARAVTSERNALVTGFVSSLTDRRRLQSELTRIAGLTTADVAVDVHDPPYCQVVEVLHRAGAWLPAAGGPAIKAEPAYRVGDDIAIAVKAPSESGGFLYVLYINSKGEIAHLVPSPIVENNQVEAGQETLIKGNRDIDLKADKPVGRDMVLAIMTPAPLFEGSPPDGATLSQYLDRLSVRLKVVGRDKPGAPGRSSAHYIDVRD